MIQQSYFQQFFIKQSTCQTEQSFNVYSKSMSEQIIKKNYEVIKIFIRRLNQIYHRQEQYDTSLKNVHQKISKIIDANDNFHYEFRATNIEQERKITMVANDILAIKNVLKIPSTITPHQTYLHSEFFKQQSSQLNTRSRGRIQKKKSIRCVQDEQNLPIEPKSKAEELPQKKRTIIITDFAEQISNTYLPTQTNIRPSEQQSLSSHANGIHSSQRLINKDSLQKLEENSVKINHQLEYLREKLQKQDSKEQDFNEKLRLLQEDLTERIDDIKSTKQECNWKHIDFDELLKYIDSKVNQLVQDKVSRSYFQESLNNLKQAWQRQQQQIYKRLDKKLEYQSFEIFHTKFAEIDSQIDQINSLNAIKIQNISFNSTSKSTPFKQSQIDMSKLCQGAKQQPKNNEDLRASRNTLKYCSSNSLLRGDEYKKKLTFDCNRSKQSPQIFEQTWKEKVNDCLGINKRINKNRKYI